MSTPGNSFAFVFPGQGSQQAGMLDSLAAEHAVVRESCDEASETLGYDMWALIASDANDQLGRTEFTQPALLTASIAAWRVWCQRTALRPSIMAGHSLGEYSALVAAEAVEFTDALRVVAERGRLMQAAVAEGAGAMVAVLGLEQAQLDEICLQAAQDNVVACVNLNAPGQTVIGGERMAVERAADLAREAGARKVIALGMSVPSHCALMQGAAEALAATLAGVEVGPPALPVIHNTDVARHDDPDAIRQALSSQLHTPVRWIETVEALAGAGVSGVVECGPGKVLSGLVKRIDRGLSCLQAGTEEGQAAAQEALEGND